MPTPAIQIQNPKGSSHSDQDSAQNKPCKNKIEIRRPLKHKKSRTKRDFQHLKPSFPSQRQIPAIYCKIQHRQTSDRLGKQAAYCRHHRYNRRPFQTEAAHCSKPAFPTPQPKHKIKKGNRSFLFSSQQFNCLDKYQAKAALAFSTNCANAALSNTAKSANTLRSISIAARFRPFMNLL